MPNIADHIARTTGCHLIEGASDNNAKALLHSAQIMDCRLQKHLYDGVVGMIDNQALGCQLTATHLKTLAAVANKSLLLSRSSPRTSSTLGEFEYMCKRYAGLLEGKRSETSHTAPGKFTCINKQPKSREFPNAKPRHTLWQHGDETYEFLTWMSNEELNRVQGRFATHEGIWGVTSEKHRTKPLHGELRTENKITLGRGAFGTVALARHVQSDTYVALKKSHPIVLDDGHVMHPKTLSIIPRVNDGTRSGIATVFLSEYLYSSSAAKTAQHGRLEKSTYTMLELGICDLQKMFDWLPLLRYLTDPANIQKDHWLRTLAELVKLDPNAAGNSRAMESPQALLNAVVERIEGMVRLSGSTFGNPETVRKFMNRLAYQMLESVNQMHLAGYAHNDIKPNNFVVATTANGLLRVKLVDFDLSDKINEKIGVPRDVYAKLFSAPQVQSTEANNNPRLNDAYSLGCSIKALDGETLPELLQRREQATGRKNEFGESLATSMLKAATGDRLLISANRHKPVRHRREIEALHDNLPELAGLHTISDLLCHPHAGKRYSVEQAMRSPPFNQPDGMLSEREFSDMLSQALRHARIIEKLQTSNQTNPANDLQAMIKDCEQTMKSFTIREFNRANTMAHLESRALARRGRTELLSRSEAVDNQIMEGNAEAHMRRLGRSLNPANLFKSKDRKEAEYSYKPRRP